ncbi:uncharacterized protein [Palaemon carinicauda]|uniref:uncharacterized protein n=1 Tax=Palaemon carinicauda TaxID=392227 RepID=UPI0035B57AA6
MSTPWMVWSLACYIALVTASIGRMVLPSYKVVEKDSISSVSDRLWSCLYSTSYIVVGGYILMKSPKLAKLLKKTNLHNRQRSLLLGLDWKEILIVFGSTLLGFASVIEIIDFSRNNHSYIHNNYGIEFGFIVTMIARSMGCFQNFMLPALFNLMISSLASDLRDIFLLQLGVPQNHVNGYKKQTDFPISRNGEILGDNNDIMRERIQPETTEIDLPKGKNISLIRSQLYNNKISKRRPRGDPFHRQVQKQEGFKSTKDLKRHLKGRWFHPNEDDIAPTSLTKINKFRHLTQPRRVVPATFDFRDFTSMESRLMNIDEMIVHLMNYFGLPLLVQLIVFATSISISLFFLVELLLTGANFKFTHAVDVLMPSINFLFINNAPDQFHIQRRICAFHYRRLLPHLRSPDHYQQISRMVESLSKKMEFSLLGFVCVGRSCVTTAMGFIISYLVICLQFREEK